MIVWLDGRIDDPNAGWKRRGLRAAINTRTSFHMEGGKGTPRNAVRFQLRPHPLAKQGNTRNRWTTIDHEAKPHDLTS